MNFCTKMFWKVTAFIALTIAMVVFLAACDFVSITRDVSGTPAGDPPATASPVGGEKEDTTSIPVLSELSNNWAPELLNRAYQILHYLNDRDYKQLGEQVHNVKGVIFSPYAFVYEDAVSFTAEGLKNVDPKEVFVWGLFDGIGDPMNLSVADYFDRFVFDHNFIQAPLIGIDNLVHTGNTIVNLEEAFPGARFVEFHFPGFNPDYGGIDWASLRLVFEQAGGQWMLIGVVHDCWTI